MRATLSLPTPQVAQATAGVSFAPTETSRTQEDVDAIRAAIALPFPSAPSADAPPRAVVNPRDYAHRIASYLLVGDWIVASLAILAALVFREWQVGPRLAYDLSSLSKLGGWSTGTGIGLVWIMMLYHTYEPQNLFRVPQFFGNLLRAIFIWSLAIWACFGLFRVEGFTPRIGAAYAAVSLFLSLSLWRVIAESILKHRRADVATSSRVLLIGWSDAARRLIDSMANNPAQFGNVIGYTSPSSIASGSAPRNLQYLGAYTSLAEIVHTHAIDQIILADLNCSAAEIQQLTRFCQRELISFQLIPNYFPALQTGLQVKTISGVPLLGINELPLDRTHNRAIKRFVDIVGSLIGIAISCMVIPWFCAIVFIESPGPVIYRQRRTSRSGRTFYIYKIRSMRLNAETSTGAVWCKKNDDRRLRVGSFMRKWNIDELPQFVNVLKGEMSLVGPRPERPELIARFKNEIPNYNARHEVRSGLTGWAQIQGLRGDTDLSKRIEADLYYMENWSVFMDFYCLVATFFKTKNAH
jgi:exopolysaccharide biosynthesis polyprenyl glycosylphosphotransferase